MKVTKDEVKKTRRVEYGKVVSNKMNKTIVVEIVRSVRDKLYGKYVKRSKKFFAHDENNSCKIGDLVYIQESRPLSKKKKWQLIEGKVMGN